MRCALFFGHAGKDSGAIDVADPASGDDLYSVESVITSCIGSKVARYLTDMDIPHTVGIGSFEQRIEGTEECAFGVSIHADVCSNASVCGYHLIHYPGSVGGAKLSKCIDHSLYRAAPRARQPHTPDGDRRLAILYDTAFPCVISEIGFLSNVMEEAQLMNENHQYSIAFSIVSGIRDYIYNGGSR